MFSIERVMLGVFTFSAVTSCLLLLLIYLQGQSPIIVEMNTIQPIPTLEASTSAEVVEVVEVEEIEEVEATPEATIEPVELESQ